MTNVKVIQGFRDNKKVEEQRTRTTKQRSLDNGVAVVKI